MKLFYRLCLLPLFFATLCTVSACGQKDALIVPIRPPAISTPYPGVAPKEATVVVHPENEKLPD